jgi:hypothetical protein
MAKSENENVYFPHFVSARNDRKIRRLRKELGVEGYGIFFMLLEVLREQSDMRYPMEDIDLLAEEFGTSEQKIRVSICNYGLFVIDSDEFFFSPKQIEYLKPYLAKSKRAKHAALVRWHGDNANADANALPEHSKSNANAMQGEERRGEESREKERRGEGEPPPIFITDIQPEQRRAVIMQHLTDTSLTEEQKKIYMLKIEANAYSRPQGGKQIPITIASIRADAELNASRGYLKTSNDTPDQSKPLPGGYWEVGT